VTVETQTYWVGARVHQALTVQDNGTPASTFDVAVLPYPLMYTEPDWQPSVVYAGQPGVWLDGLAPGTHRIWARLGEGAPDERDILFCGYIEIRGH
jgi:hypothetical protein